MSDEARDIVTRRWFVRTFGLVAGSLLFGGLTGCRDSDTLYETHYVDWSDDIDYDNELKNILNRPDKDPTSSLPRIYDTESEAEDEILELPEYEDIPNPNDETAQQKYNENATDNGAASSGSKEGSNGSDANGSSGGGNAEGSSGDGTNSGSGQGDGQGNNGIGNGEGEVEVSGSVGGNKPGKNPTKKDATAKPDKQGPVIAFGEMANVALLLSASGGDGLWAADKEFCTAAKTAYGSSYSPSKIRSGYWAKSSSGTSSSKFKELCADLDAEKASKRPVYVVYDDAVGCPLSDAQADKLASRYGIETIYFSVNRRYYLQTAMNYIQQILTNYGAKKRYNAYKDFHDTLLSEINNGKLAAFAGPKLQNKYFDPDKTGTISASKQVSDPKWTLVIDSWDEGATYKYDQYSLKSVCGLGVSHVGYQWSPVSYYLQCGGVINNAAAWRQCTNATDKVSKKYVWQFHATNGMPRGSYLSGGSLSGYDVFSNSSGEEAGFNGGNLGHDLDVLLLAKSCEFGAGNLGSVKDFPAVIVRDSTMEGYMKRSCKSGGIYGAHYLAAGATYNNNVASVGIREIEGSQWKSFVGYAGSGVAVSSQYKNTDTPFDIYVNPHGVYSSWLDGGVEAVLEAAWACEQFGISSVNTSYGDSAKKIVKQFYTDFYGNSSPDTTKILNGSYA